MGKLEEIIYSYVKTEGIIKMGICAADPFEELRPVLQKKSADLKGFVEQDIEKRIDPKISLPGAYSIVVFALPYGKQFLFELDQIPRARLSDGAIGLDYHIILREKLKGLAETLSACTQHQYVVFVDTGPFVDREVAKRAGIGFYGKNGAIIVPEAGSMVFIGALVTTLKLEPSPIIKGDCGKCTKCIQACPTGALQADGSFESKKCISYLTQTKGTLTIEQMKQIGKQLYGCDICQKVCPYNHDQEKEPIYTIEEAMPSIEKLMHYSNKEFTDKFGLTAAGWRGKKPLQRNALAALANSQDTKSQALLQSYVKDSREWVRETASVLLSAKKGDIL